MAQRRQSAPSLVIRGVLGRSNKLPPSLYRDDGCDNLGPANNSQRLSLKFGSHGAMLNLSKREYIMEGKVELTTGMQTQDRYMFLFSDLLLIAKAKSGSNYKLKSRVRVCELWIASCIDDVCELTKPPARSFVIGWPTANCVATFSSPESKELWLNALLKKINEEKEKESPKTTTLKVINRDESNASHVKFVAVSHTDTAMDVVRLAIKEFDLNGDENDFQLWVISRKERTAYPLIGHEIPHAIQISNVRDTLSANGMISEMDFTSLSRYQSLISPEVCNKCKFILRSNRQAPNKFNGDPMHWRSTRIKPKTPASFFNWARKRHASNQNGHRNDSSDSGLASLSGNSGNDGTSYSSPSPPLNSSPTSPKLFSLPLTQVCEDGEIPKPITEILNILYRKAPYTTGIFRKSANAKTTRLLKQKLNEDLDANMSEAPIHVVAALFKDFLRNIPNSVLNCDLYNKWTDAIDQEDDEDKLDSLRNLFSELGDANRLLVWRMAVVLGRVVSHSKYNNMTSYNLSVCIAPSLLWPPGLGIHPDAPRKVTEILQFIIDHCEDVFEGIIPQDENWPPAVDSQEEEDHEFNGENDISNGVEEKKLHELKNKLENGEFDDESDMEHFKRSELIRQQLHKRHLKSGPRLRRLLSVSQDGLEQVLDNNTLESDGSMLDEILLNDINPDNRITRTQPMRRRGLDACNMSNDSGFTTLSGEEDDAIPTSHAGSLRAFNARFGYGNFVETRKERGHNHVIDEENCGGNTTLLVEGVSGIDVKNIEMEDEVTDERLRKIHLKVGLNPGQDFLSEPRPSRLSRRRQSQPVLSMSGRNLLKTPEVEFIREDFAEPTIRAPIATPDPPDVEEEDETFGNGSGLHIHDRFLPTSATSEEKPFSPKYARLNDALDSGSYESGERKVDILKEYMRELRDRKIEEAMDTFSTNMDISASPRNRDHDSPTKHALSPSAEITSPGGMREHFASCKYVEINGENERSFSSTTTEITIDTTQPKYLSPIQKLTVQLNSLPKFRERSMSTHDEATTVPESPILTRATSSSVRLHRRRNRHAQSAPAHVTKAKPPLQATRSSGSVDKAFDSKPRSAVTKRVEIYSTRSKMPLQATRSSSSIEDAFESEPKSVSRVETHIETFSTRSKLPPHATRSSSSIDVAVEAQPKSSSRLSPQVQSAKHENGAPYGGSLPRRRRNRIPKLVSTFHNRPLSPSEGENLFSSSLPARQREKRGSGSRSPGRHLPVAMDNYKDENMNLRRSSPSKEKHCASSYVGAHGPTSLRPARPAKLEINAGVKSKIDAYNDIISGHEITVTPRSRYARLVGGTPTRESPASEADTPTVFPPKRVLKSLKSIPIDFESVGRESADDDSPNFCTRSQDHRSLKQNLRARNRSHSRHKANITISCSPPQEDDAITSPARMLPKEYSSPIARRRSQQILSDELLFSLSESFAFGNRKSPRSLTPCGTPRRSLTPRDSPVLPRRINAASPRREHDRPRRESSNEQDILKTREHHEAERHQVDGARPASRSNESNDTAQKYAIPALISSPSCRRKESGDIFPFLGFEKVIHSEESYV